MITTRLGGLRLAPAGKRSMRKPSFIAAQGRKPSGLLGRIVARVMATETAKENDYALDLLRLKPSDTVLEVGSGHGNTLAKAAKFVSHGRLCGIDFSPIMHRRAMHHHRRLVADRRVDFRLGSSDNLPFDDGFFDKVFAVHTIYFWDLPLDHLREARRVLKPSGFFVLGFRPAEDAQFKASFPIGIYNIRPEAGIVDLVKEAGFDVADVQRKVIGGRHFSYVIARSTFK